MKRAGRVPAAGLLLPDDLCRHSYARACGLSHDLGLLGDVLFHMLLELQLTFSEYVVPLWVICHRPESPDSAEKPYETHHQKPSDDDHTYRHCHCWPPSLKLEH